MSALFSHQSVKLRARFSRKYESEKNLFGRGNKDQITILKQTAIRNCSSRGKKPYLSNKMKFKYITLASLFIGCFGHGISLFDCLGASNAASFSRGSLKYSLVIVFMESPRLTSLFICLTATAFKNVHSKLELPNRQHQGGASTKMTLVHSPRTSP